MAGAFARENDLLFELWPKDGSYRGAIFYRGQFRWQAYSRSLVTLRII